MTDSKYNFQKLTPTNKVDLGIYEEAMNYIFKNSDVRNIGISGAYSAGKSSVIESYKSINPDTKFMHISLACFQSVSQEDRQDNTQNENIIEGKIINQLMHQINPEKIPQTNFRVKRQISERKLWVSSFLITLFSILVLYIFNFDKWSAYVETIPTQGIKDCLWLITTPFSAFIAGAIGSAILFYMIFKMIEIQFNKSVLKGISVQGNKIEIFEQSEESYFDKYLNEVLYLFENSGAKVIVFEDIDRYNTNKIFQRLREINTLINNRMKAATKPMRFFYLVRDDLFISKERTKFFDFIVPIVPVLDGSNSFDQFIDHFRQGNIYDLFDEHFLQEISLYIDDMRVLKNIYNEFIVYYEKISTTEQNPNKLFAIIIYKNIFPRDFSELQLRIGYVYTLFNRKNDILEEEIEKYQKEIEELKQIIQSSDKECFESKQELDEFYQSKINKAYYNEEKALIEARENRKGHVENKHKEKRELINQRISEMSSNIMNIRGKKLCELLNKKNSATFFKTNSVNEVGVVFEFKEIKESDYFPLIKYLIRKGYIDETYPDYMTYFYENSLSRIDKVFLRSVVDEEPKEYCYQLKEPERIIRRLGITYFDKEEIVNIDLLAYLLENKTDDNKEKMFGILKQIQEKNDFDFIFSYFQSGKSINVFVRELNKSWINIFEVILAASNLTDKQKRMYVLESIYNTDNEILKKMNKDNTLSEFISNSEEFSNIPNPHIQRIIEVLQLLNVKFVCINYANSNKELFQNIYAHDLYAIDFSLVCLILENVYGCTNLHDLKHKNYTVILSKSSEPLLKYINQNINKYVKFVTDNCDGSIVDEEETVLQILNNEEVELSLKIAYIENLETSINVLEDVDNVALWAQLLINNLVVYSESNVLQYFFKSGNYLDDVLEDYINDNGVSFNFDYDEINNLFAEGYASKFFTAVVKSKKLNIDFYASILKSLNRCYTSFNIKDISDTKMDVLISQHRITMIPDVLLFMREHYPQKIIYFIKKNIRVYIEEVISEDNYDFDEMLKIFDADVDDQYKLALLKYTDESISVISTSYSDELKIHIFQNNFDEDDFPHILMDYSSVCNKLQTCIEEIAVTKVDDILKNKLRVGYSLCKKLLATVSIDDENRLQIFSIALRDLDKEECKECLVILKREDFLSSFNGKRPTIPATATNKLILDIFLEKQWIAGYELDKKDKSLFRISSKRVQKN